MRILLILFALSHLFANENSYQRFKSYMQSQVNSVYTIKFDQSQYGESLYSNGKIYFKSPEYFIFETKSTQVSYKQNFITTINKETNQIIYDDKMLGEISVFDLLSGKEEVFVPSEIMDNGTVSNILFDLNNFNMVGSLEVDRFTGEPKKVILRNNSSGKTIITIKQLKIEDNYSVFKIDSSLFEIIDLRE